MSDPKKRKHHHSVSAHYDHQAQQQAPRSEYYKSGIAHVKTVNNFIKVSLINEFARAGQVVVDLASGRGGDLRKWKLAGAGHLICVDVSLGSVEEAQNRHVTDTHPTETKVEFIVADAWRMNLRRVVPYGCADVVSCQMALHYSFESERTARGALCNIASMLKPGGRCIATLVDGEVMMSKWKWQNSVAHVSMSAHAPEFGLGYHFTLNDAVDGEVEYIVSLSALVKMARTFKLNLVWAKNFHQFFQDQSATSTGRVLMQQMHVPANIEPDQWDTIGMYRIVVFEREPGPLETQVAYIDPAALTESVRNNIRVIVPS